MTEVHVDDWIDDPSNPAYARLWLRLFRRPAADKISEANRIITDDEFLLFATHNGHRYRVTGCSCLGDVWLSADFKKTTGYDLRVNLAECSDWSPDAEARN